MAARFVVVLTFLLTLVWASAAQADQPGRGLVLTGKIQFPRPQIMSITTDDQDSSKLTISLGFDGRCTGGGIGEAWGGNVPAKPIVRTSDGRVSATLTGSMKRLGGVNGRVGNFRWRLTGRFTDDDVFVGTVDGTRRRLPQRQDDLALPHRHARRVRLAVRS